jgi:tetratricopeptide (TPR) repeat protein
MRRIYKDYYRLGATAYREKMKFYENHQRYLDSLDFDDATDMKLDYLGCLFEVGRYERYLQYVDEMLVIVISENIKTYKGEDIFVDLLFKKAACLYQIKEYTRSMNILAQLRNMAPSHRLVIDLYGLCKRKIPDDLRLTIKAIGMASLTLIAGIALTKIIVVDAFYSDAIAFFSSLQMILVGVALSSFALAECLFQYRIYKEIGMYPSPWINYVAKLWKSL